MRREVQPEDGRIRRWVWVAEIGRHLRVVALPDGVTLRLSPQQMQAMRLNYDAATDSLYIHLAERPSVDSDEVVDGVVLDYDPSSALVGIDVQHASQKADIHPLAISHLPLTRLDAA